MEVDVNLMERMYEEKILIAELLYLFIALLSQVLP